MNQAQFSVLDALIVGRIGITDEKELIIMAALAWSIAQTGSLTASAQLTALALQVWG